MNSEVTKLPPEAIAAWLEYEPPVIQSANPLIVASAGLRHAFMSGFLAAQIPSQPSDATASAQPHPRTIEAGAGQDIRDGTH